MSDLQRRRPGERRIEDYALIGDGETAALVSREGSVDWLCLPRFDSDACLASLLGGEENGYWRISPQARSWTTHRRYEPDTLVLETTFETRGGEVTLTDFMPLRSGDAPAMVRIVEGRRGRVKLESRIAVRFDYGRIHPRVEHLDDNRTIHAVGGPHGLTLRSDVAGRRKGRSFQTLFQVAAGERVNFVLTWAPSHLPPATAVDPEAALGATRRAWSGWTAGVRCEGPNREQVKRSLITLKAMVHTPTGGIVAAPTAGLPEEIGGARNWDYRYCWLRDATFTLMAMINAGLREEARAWVEWLLRTVAGLPVELQPFYTVDGGRRLPEWEADWLGGFQGSRPVRFGNGAVDQLQLDIFGEVIDTLFVAGAHNVHDHSGELIGELADCLSNIWRKPDAGIWESRGPPRHHTYSKAMCWVAFDRAARWFAGTDPRRSARYRRLADQAHALTLRRGFCRRANSFVRAFDDRALDAATLRLALVGFLAPDDSRMVGTVEAIERRLIKDGLVARYETRATNDGVGGEEGTFLAASFWLADVYTLQGRHEDARRLFDRVCRLANDVGLLSEEAGSEGRLLGNFPQALSHLAMVNTALNLSSGGGAALERSGAPQDR
jgi:GH15 family glucan-1,4-alpha-glucosidase